MARPASQQVAGYFPTPSSLLPSFASTLRWPRLEETAILLDPCAGDGEAIVTLRDLWAEAAGIPRDAPPYATPQVQVIACELEASRAGALLRRLAPSRDQAHRGDAFRLAAVPELLDSGHGATVLYLNPPYDHDREHGRLEQRFLARFTRFLAAGRGTLLFLVPGPSLAASAAFLAEHYLEHRAWRLPEPEYSAFGQVLLVARRASRRIEAPMTTARLRRWADDPSSLPVLPAVCDEPLELDLPAKSLLYLSLQPLDLEAAIDSFDPWCDVPVGTGAPLADLFGARLRTAVPPKPAHIALALSAGMFDGERIEPNCPDVNPPLLAKGSFGRERIAVSEKVDRNGDRVGAVEVEVPRLDLTILRLDTGTFHALAPGIVPTGELDPARWNAADLIAGYDRALAKLLTRRFPPLHNPLDAAGRLPLPALARQPSSAQAHAVEAALKLLATGRNPFLIAEVGTGKSTMAVTLAAALAPAHVARTREALERLGFTGRVPTVRRTLVVCPPHLLTTWAEEIAAVRPEAKVAVLRSVADLDAYASEPADFALLTRETAKLGAPIRGVEGRCPRCGTAIDAPIATRASRRLRCPARPRQPKNAAAFLASHLAWLLAPELVGESTIEEFVPARALEVFQKRGARPIDPSASSRFLDAVLATIRRLRAEEEAAPGLYDLVINLPRLARSLPAPDAATRITAFLRALIAGSSIGEQVSWGPVGWAATALCELESKPGCAVSDAPLDDLQRLLSQLVERAEWIERGVCGEPLFQTIPEPRRAPLARRILRRHRRLFDLVVLDEAHEYAHAGSAQSKAALRLTTLPGVPTVVLTGSLMGGYATSLFPLFWGLSADFREEFERTEQAKFSARYGYRKLLVVETRAGKGDRGRVTDRELAAESVIGEAPGIVPDFLMRHLLPTAVLVHKSDLDRELPPLVERPVPLGFGGDPLAAELLDEYRRLERTLLERIRGDRGDGPSKLLGALVELPSYLDRATDDLAPFAITDPLSGAEIARGRAFPASWLTPKEDWLVETVRRRVEAGERVLVYLRHTGTGELPRRLLRLLEDVAPRALWLDAKKVPAAKRQAWIDEHVLAPDVPVLLVNPNAVRTGLNNLVAFNVGLWYELDYSATTYRQANGRLHRIGQTKPVEILFPYYAGTAQEIAFDLVAKKVSTALQVDGLDLQAALEAAGASEDHAAALASTLSIGRAVWARLAGVAAR